MNEELKLDRGGRTALDALRLAAQDALESGRRTKTPVWVCRDERWVDALAESRSSYFQAQEPEPMTLAREDPSEDEKESR